MSEARPIDEDMMDKMAVAPGDPEKEERGNGHADAGCDRSIEERLARNPESKEARLDNALDESMDASDPPASTQPVHAKDPAPSSGYDAEKEAARKSGE